MSPYLHLAAWKALIHKGLGRLALNFAPQTVLLNLRHRGREHTYIAS